MIIQPAITAYTVTSSLGCGLEATRASIAAGNTGLTPADFPHCDVPTWLGAVRQLSAPEQSVDDRWDSRNNRLAKLGLLADGFTDAVAAAVTNFGADRVGVLMGTSTSSVGRTERAYREMDDEGRWLPKYHQPDTHHPHSPGAFVADYLGVRGPALTISTACSSSARVFASAERWLRVGLVDAVVVGGVDTLCLNVIYGFNALQLVSMNRCRPFDDQRDGLNLGEAAGFALLEKPSKETAGALRLCGYGESSDAHHMSSAHPEGLGARLAIEAALGSANCSVDKIDYLNLHGTSTRANDEIEGSVCADIFGSSTMMSATKSWTGHTLGAAGIVESVFCLEALTTGVIPGTLTTSTVSGPMEDRLVLENQSADPRFAMTNSFGFGGNNCSLIFGHVA